ncbi:MAG: hypothetical protein JWN88_373 [Frankiales bacterium]|nr:hypothetical protein [Frankiales bacterium]
MSLSAAPKTSLADQLEEVIRAVRDGRTAPDAGSDPLQPLRQARPLDRRDRFRTLLAIYDIHTAPLQEVGAAARLQGSPSLAELKGRLEAEWLTELEQAWEDAGHLSEVSSPDDVVKAMRVIAAKDRLPPAYTWLAKSASYEQVVDFLALEGGPDGGFDDLVAVCQVGLSGTAKLELGKNYWDEMGQGDLAGVHTTMYESFVEAIAMPVIPRDELPVEALERAALGGMLATNRWLQPEMIGALGLLELQAGPRCRLVLQAFDRVGAPAGAYPFYAEHAQVDPIHGKDWMDKAIEPLAAELPGWGPRMVRGAWWRSTLNLRFFESVRANLVSESAAA